MQMPLRVAAGLVALATLCVEVVILLGLEAHPPDGAGRWVAPFVALAALAPTFVGGPLPARRERLRPDAARRGA